MQIDRMGSWPVHATSQGEPPSGPLQADLLIQNGVVITMDAERRVYTKGYVAIKDGKIAQVGGDPPADLRSDRVIDASRSIILPGLVNAHAHLDQTLYRGLFDDISPGNREELMGRMNMEQTTDHAYAAARLTLLELVKNGVTTTTEAYWVNAHPGSMDGICRAVHESGLRGLLSRVISNHHRVPAIRQEWRDVVREIEDLKARWDSEHITVTAEASPVGCTEETLRSVHSWARGHGLLWSMHVQTEQVAALWDSHRLGPMQYLHQIGVLDESILAAHCNVLLPGEMKLMADAGARVAHSPVAQLWASKPVAYLMEFLSLGIRVGLGVDGPYTNNGQNLWESMKFAIYAQKQKYPHPLAIGSPELALELVTVRAAEAIGMADRVGSLEPGKEADLILLDRKNPCLNPTVGLLANLVYAGTPEAVETVIIGGKVVMEGRRCTLVDEDEIVDECNRAQRAMVEAAGLDGPHVKRSQWLFL